MVENPTDWNWLKDTYWYVQDTWLPALQFDASKNTISWLVDQTVWHITGYRDGYFWGVTAALVYTAGEEVPARGPRSHPNASTLIGTITPDGAVELTFVENSGRSSGPTVGVGRIVEKEGRRSFEMQMSTGTGDPLTAHWAYMMQTRKGEPSWEKLPGVGLSVPEMLGGIDPPTTEDS